MAIEKPRQMDALIGEIIYRRWIFRQAMFDYRKVNPTIPRTFSNNSRLDKSQFITVNSRFNSHSNLINPPWNPIKPHEIPLNPSKPPFSYGFPMVFLWISPDFLQDFLQTISGPRYNSWTAPHVRPGVPSSSASREKWKRPGTSGSYTLWETYKKLWKITIFNGKTQLFLWQFSIAMLNYQRVYMLLGTLW